MIKRKLILSVFVLVLTLLISGCRKQAISESAEIPVSEQNVESTSVEQMALETESLKELTINDNEVTQENAKEETETMLQMKIGETLVAVEWEKNQSVQALKDLCTSAPLTIQMSMYGGFEQVGYIGSSLPRNDVQTVTRSGDIVLYSGNQIVVFYGSNSWAYTRLGHITSQDAAGLAKLLGNGDVTITIDVK